MKKILLIFSALLTLVGCAPQNNTPVTEENSAVYKDVDFVIVKKGEDKDGKFLLIRGLRDSQIYAEYRGLCGNMPDSKYDLHKEGDILHFDQVRKDRFFRVSSSSIDSKSIDNETVDVIIEHDEKSKEADGFENIDYNK